MNQHSKQSSPIQVPNEITHRRHDEHEGSFDCVEFSDVPEPMVAAHIPMQED